jgi:hypothetical protein
MAPSRPLAGLASHFRSWLTSDPVGRRPWFILLALVFAVSRLIYFAVGVRPDTEPIDFYWQYIEPSLLKDHLWQSLLYLREQPPGYNLYLGLVLKAPVPPEAIFFVIHLAMGFALAVCLMALMMRLGVANWLAFLLAALFTSSPMTVLYENWVFYEYPVMASLTVAAWAMLRYILAERFRHALIFFLSLAVISSVRGVYNLGWFFMLGCALIWATRDHWKRGLLAAAIPALLLSAFYVKNFVMFGDLFPGQQVFRKMNYGAMVQMQAPKETIDRLKREGKISGILQLPVLETDTPSYAGIVKQPPPTGIPLLDMAEKPSGDNWNSLWRSKVADLYYHDAQIVARQCPGLIWKQVPANVQGYLLPATDVFPFNDTPNSNHLRPFLDWYERISAGELSADPDSNPTPWLNVFLLPASLVGGLALAVREFLNSRQNTSCGAGTRACSAETRLGAPVASAWTSKARCLTILFLLFNISYDSAVTILFSVGDHNRYREEVAPLYLVLIGLLLNAAWTRFRAWRRGSLSPS